MGGTQPADSKYLVLWVSVSLVAVIIIGGWLFSAKYNITKINLENDKQSLSNSEVVKEVENIFSDFNNIMEEDAPAKLFKIEDVQAAEEGVENEVVLEAVELEGGELDIIKIEELENLE